MSLDVEVRPLSAAGVLYAFSSIDLEEGKVFVGYVDLPEKVRVFARLLGFGAGEPPTCGLTLRLIEVRPPGTGPQFVFGPASQPEHAQ